MYKTPAPRRGMKARRHACVYAGVLSCAICILLAVAALSPHNIVPGAWEEDRLQTESRRAGPLPRTLHLIWIDADLLHDSPLPPELQANVRRWEELNPAWAVTVWRSSTVRRAFPELTETIRAYRVMSWQSDILRYKILYELGGLYLDTDITPLRPLPESLLQYPFAVCQKPLAFAPGPCVEACTAVMGAPPRLPVMDRLLQNVLWRSRIHHQYLWWMGFHTYISGPPVLSSFVLDTFEILPTHTFFPCWYRNRSACVAENFQANTEVLAMHTWRQSWKGDTKFDPSEVWPLSLLTT